MYRRVSAGWVKHLDFIILDLLTLQLSFVLACWIRHGWSNPYGSDLYRNMGLLLAGTDALLLTLSGLLSGVQHRGYWREFTSCAASTALLLLACTFYLFSIKAGQDFSRAVVYITGVLYLCLNYLVRCLWKHHIKREGSSRAGTAMLVAADRQDMEAVLARLRDNAYNLPRLTGLILLDGRNGEDAIEDVPVVADLHTMADYICTNWVDELLIVGREHDIYSRDTGLSDQLEQIAAAGVVVHRVIGLGLQNSGRSQLVEKFAGYTVLTDSVKIVSLRQAVLKRTIDLLGAVAGCLLCGIALLVVGPMIYIKSPGPIIFKQKRVGRNGKIFTIYKMRSMVMDAEKRKQELLEQNRVSDGMMFKLEFDPRIIGCKLLPDGTVKKGIGNYIRDWSIDELPQFFNVLKGDMSLVGTRPPTLDEWEKYQLHHRARMAFRPGITGMWQVSGRSQITNFEDVVKLDMHYISNWDIGMDFRILLETVKVVLGRKGAM